MCCNVAFICSGKWGLPAFKPRFSSALSLQDSVSWAGSSLDISILKKSASPSITCLSFPLLVFWAWSPNFSLLWAAGASGNKLKCLHFWEVMHCTSQLPFRSCSLVLHAHARTPPRCTHTHPRWQTVMLWGTASIFTLFYNPWLECPIL